MNFDRWLAANPGRGRGVARVACVSAALELGLEVLRSPTELHLWAPPSANVPRAPGVVWHRSMPIGPSAYLRHESLVEVLGHVARCLPHVEALVVWESAIRSRKISVAELRRIRWRHAAARALLPELTGLSDSLLETMAVDMLRHAGIAVRQQVMLLGHRVDVLVGGRLVLQLDGDEFHSTPQARSRDARHDAELRLAGCTVLRFTYQQMIERPDYVLATVVRALEQGLHERAG